MTVQEMYPELRGRPTRQREPFAGKHAISEYFDSIQGEGLLAGAPSTFIRYAFCNLSCSWCDAAYTWKGKVESTEMTTEELVDVVRHQHVVLTGGEPTDAEGFSALLSALRYARHHLHITVETNGTKYWRDIDPESIVNLWSVSPKLGSSGQSEHLRPEIVQHYVDLPQRSQLKFVVDSQDDLIEVEKFLSELRVPPTYPVYMQPNGLCHNAVVTRGDAKKGHSAITDGSVPNWFDTKEGERIELATPYGERYRWLIEAVLRSDLPLKYDIRVLPQCHKLAFGNKRGF